jgi:hypothetical protein
VSYVWICGTMSAFLVSCLKLPVVVSRAAALPLITIRAMCITFATNICRISVHFSTKVVYVCCLFSRSHKMEQYTQGEPSHGQQPFVYTEGIDLTQFDDDATF